MPKFRKKLYGDAFVNQFIAEMEKQMYHSRPFALIDTEGNRYSHIAGAITLPTMDQDGYLIVMGVEYESNKFQCLAEFQSESEYEIVKEAQDIQKEYGPGMVSMWYGNPTALMTIVNEVGDKDNPVLLAHPIDYELPDAFQLYVSRLRVALNNEYKTLYLNNCDVLRNHLISFAKDKTAKMDNNPVMTAAGSLVHTLLVLRPWEQAVETTTLIPTKSDEMTAWAFKQEEKHLMRELYGMEL